MGMEVEKYATKYTIFGKTCQVFPTGAEKPPKWAAFLSEERRVKSEEKRYAAKAA